MFVTAQLLRVPARLVQAALGRWHASSREVARRNALAACIVLAERRRELDEVETYLAALAGASASPSAVATGLHRGA